jgi:hypothetical protein
MMTLKRFRTLADTYGADLQRWPESERTEALAMLDASAEAQAIIARARELDEAIMAARTARDARVWGTESPTRALHRLHARVSAHTHARASAATGAAHRLGLHAVRRSPPHRMRWIGFATAAGLAVLAGLALGILYSPSAPPQDLTALLQPAPLQLSTD